VPQGVHVLPAPSDARVLSKAPVAWAVVVTIWQRYWFVESPLPTSIRH
jgi:hypothetical protein